MTPLVISSNARNLLFVSESIARECNLPGFLFVFGTTSQLGSHAALGSLDEVAVHGIRGVSAVHRVLRQQIAIATAENAAAHKQTEHYNTWRETVADMMAEPRQGVRYSGL